MLSANDIIANSLAGSQQLLRRYTGDLTAAEYLHRAFPKSNCTAWLIGHLVLSDRRALTSLGVSDLPPLPEGFEKRFARDDNAPFASDFGDVMILMPLWDRHRTMLIEAVKRARPEQLQQPLDKPHPMFTTVGEMINFMALHATMHAGQITMIRRSLGRPPLV